MNIDKNKSVKTAIIIVYGLLTAFFLSSCATVSRVRLGNLFSKDEQKEEQYSKYEDYLLGPDDIVRIVVEQHPEWSGDFIVGPDGKVVIPGLGGIFAEGLSREEFGVSMEKHLEKYINNPRITVDIVQYASQVIYVLGEVNRPGRYSTMGKKLTLRDIVISAGFPTSYAAASRVFIISPSRKDPQRQVVNLHRILYRGELRRNIALKPGDVVYVPKNLLGIVSNFISSLLSPFSSISAARAAVAPETVVPITVTPIPVE